MIHSYIPRTLFPVSSHICCVHFSVCQLQLQREAEEQRLKEEEEKKEKLCLLRERKQMEKKASFSRETLI